MALLKNRPVRAAVIAGLAFVYVFAAIYTQVKVNAGLEPDLGIYLSAGAEALQHIDPYHSSAIGWNFIYPPPALLVFAPLSLLPAPQASILWAVLNALAYLLGLSFVRLAFRSQRQHTWVIPFMVAALTFSPLLETLTIGQINCIVFLGLALFALGLTHPSYRWAGDIGLAAACLIKISPAILLAAVIVLGDWRRCLRVAASMAVLVALSIGCFGLESWLDFFRVMPKLFGGFGYIVNLAITPSTRWLLNPRGPSPQLPWLAPLFSATVLGTWLLVVVRFRRAAAPLASVSFGMVAMTISSTVIWYHHLIFLIIPFGYLLSVSSKRARSLNWLTFGAWLSLYLIQLDRVFERRTGWPPFPAIAGYLLAYCLFLGWFLMLRRSAIGRRPYSAVPQEMSD